MKLLLSILLGVIVALIVLKATSGFRKENILVTGGDFDMAIGKVPEASKLSQVVAATTGRTMTQEQLASIMSLPPAPAPSENNIGVVLPAPTPAMSMMQPTTSSPVSALGAAQSPAAAAANAAAAAAVTSDGSAAGASTLAGGDISGLTGGMTSGGGGMVSGGGTNINMVSGGSATTITGTIPLKAQGSATAAAPFGVPAPSMRVSAPAPMSAPASSPMRAPAPGPSMRAPAPAPARAPASVLEPKTRKEVILEEIDFVLSKIHH